MSLVERNRARKRMLARQSRGSVADGRAWARRWRLRNIALFDAMDAAGCFVPEIGA